MAHPVARDAFEPADVARIDGQAHALFDASASARTSAADNAPQFSGTNAASWVNLGVAGGEAGPAARRGFRGMAGGHVERFGNEAEGPASSSAARDSRVTRH